LSDGRGKSLLALASAVTFGSGIHGTHDHVLVSLGAVQAPFVLVTSTGSLAGKGHPLLIITTLLLRSELTTGNDLKEAGCDIKNLNFPVN
jgi:hypothetical protein